MSRGQGRVFRPTWNGRESRVWWLDYAVGGQRHRESSGTTAKGEAQRILRERLGGREAGRLVGRPDRVTFAELRALVERQYVIDGRRSGKRLTRALAPLEGFFGTEARAVELTPARIDAYTASRLAAGYARATVGYELAVLRRMLRLANEKGVLAAIPQVKLPKVENARQGFFDEGDLAALFLELPEPARSVVRFALLTGWRLKSEVFPLTWGAVDWEAKVIRLAAHETKGGDRRTFPFGQDPALEELLDAWWAQRDGPYVFHRNGKRIRSTQTAWRNARRRAGLADRIPHDLRRTAAREFRRAGVSEGEIMKLCGWKTRAMFDRYNIIDEQDLAAAVAKRALRQASGKHEPVSPALPPQ